ncbi:hypothetical protein GSI_14739 [Ganoderma sinense ZZ0214-1]|uniref:Uncharacterized protein n=1 Tax=Ganoderma sinense ZZ0214-1 TaxID=1077348 RepID=A0A2G8RQ08_9APHY|nr:hypothetical protein GSI_14739 [Ganoderma sinense ZZ0214-1]
MSATASSSSTSQLDAAHYSISGDSLTPSSDSDRSHSASGQTSSTSGPDDPSVAQVPNPGKPPRRKEPLKDFKWGENLVRKTLPVYTIPNWLNPSYVDVADPTEIPLCWYGVPFDRDLIYPYTERIGLASYYKEQMLRCQPGDLDVFRTWVNMVKWFEKLTGLKLDLNQVWGRPTPILTFFSNHELPRITKKQVSRIYDLLDDMDYDENSGPMWYLDQSLNY